MQNLTISEVARTAGLTPSALRYYEKIGLLPPAKRSGGQRRYDAAILDRLAVIRFARHAGFALKEVEELFRGFPADTPPTARWQRLARRKLADLDALIERARGMKRLLEAGLQCRCLSLAECGRAIRASMDSTV